MPTALVALGAALALVLAGPVGPQAAFEEPDPAATGHLGAPSDPDGRSVEFGLGALSVRRDGVGSFGLAPGGLKVLSADLVTGSYELAVDEPGERDAGFLSLDLTFAAGQPVDDGAAPQGPGSVRTSIGVVNVIVRDAQDRELTTRLAPTGTGLRIDVEDSGDVAYPLSVGVSRVAPFSKTTAFSLGEREIDLGGTTELDPFLPAPTVSALNACSYLDVSAGTYFTLALGSDHLVYAWGAGESGQLGEVGLAQHSGPGLVPVLTNINAIAAGGSHGVALDAAGVVWTWGANGDGQLGIGSILNTATPTPVAGLPPIVAIAAGGMHTLAVGADESLWAWGENGVGQLGDGTNGQKTSPVQVMPPGSGVVGAAAGFEHSLVVLSDETLRAFGANDAGQLGDGVASPFSLVPVVVAGPGGYVGVSAGWKHSLAWKNDGSAWSWGGNGNGQLGDGSFAPRDTPGPVGALPGNVVFMDAGSNHSLAVKSDGTAHAWGANFSGQLGNGAVYASEPNAFPVPGISGALRIAGGWEHSVVVRAGGRVDSWGRNVEGQLGIGLAAFNTFPAHVVDADLDGFLAGVVQVSTGLSHSLAVKTDGSVWAWGSNNNGQIGDGSLLARPFPVQVMAPGSGAIAVAAGHTHSLALLSSGEVRAWGSDSTGQLGNGTASGGQLTPGTVYLSGGPTVLGSTALTGIAQIAAGNGYSLAREAGGAVRSWGSDADGRLGNGAGTAADQHNANLFVKGPGGVNLAGIVDIDAGDAHGLAVKGDGTVYAWGLNGNGQLGQGNVASPFAQAAIVSGLGIGSGVIGVTAGDFHSAAWFAGGSAKAWGKNLSGQLGDGTTTQRLLPVSVLGIANVVEMDAGTAFTIARIGSLPPNSPNVRSWGSNSGGRLGDGSFSQRELPVVVRDLVGATQISAGGAQALARVSDGTVWGWGDATLDALGVNYKPAVPNARKVDFGPQCSNQAPSCNAGTDIVADCDGPQLNGSGTDLDGDPLTYAWTTTCSGVAFSPNANVPNPEVYFNADCGVICDFTLTVSDPNGGVCNDTVNVIVQDGVPPTPAMGAIEACYQTLGEAELAAKDATDWSDNCTVGAEYVSSDALSCTVHISVSAEDLCGNLATAVVYTTIIDSEPPQLFGVPAPVNAECSNVPPPAVVTAVDGCAGPVSVDFTETPSGNLCGEPTAGPGTITRTWTAVDACGNTASASQVITLVDTIDPVLVGIPADTSVECGEPWPVPPTVTATDNCDTLLTPAMLDSTGAAGCAGTGLVRTWTVYDDCGNFDTKSQIITVVDTTPPELVGVPADISVPCTSIPEMATVTATDICDFEVGVTPAEVRTDGSCPDRYTLTRTWTATDDCGNTIVGTQIITVTDEVAPVLAGVPGPVTVECDAIPAVASPTASDDCDPEPGITLDETTEPGSCPQSYTLSRTWTATDRCGNSSSQTQVITVLDTTAPILVGVPGPITVSCDAVPEPADVTATDNCGIPDVAMVPTITPGGCPQSYTLRRTWTATDPCGNSTSAFQDITVVDLVAPTLNGVPADATVQCNAVPAPAAVTAGDNCDGAPTLSFSETTLQGDCPQSYTLTRTWTAEDHCGNSTSASQVLTVVDTTAPSIAGVPANQTVQCDAVPAPASPTASDNCDATPTLTFAETTGSGPCASSYTVTRTWTATDDCGNSAQSQQVLTVIDTTSPVVTPRSTDLYCLWPANHQYEMFTRSQFSPTITDNCNANPNWRFIGCTSNQPDDAPGGVDGNTSNDCVIDPDGQWFKARAERDGKKAGGRRYTITIVADDGCGNNSSVTQIGYIYVPLKQPGNSCLAPNDGM